MKKEEKTLYFAILKLFKKVKPSFEAKDALGRTCLHHAAAAGNIFGLEFTRNVMNYWSTKGVEL